MYHLLAATTMLEGVNKIGFLLWTTTNHKVAEETAEQKLEMYDLHDYMFTESPSDSRCSSL